MFDIVFTLILTIIFSPLLVFIALAIKIFDPGPVLYKARRVGKGRKIFNMFKFRTMVINADKIGGPSTSGADPRITTIGSLLRKFKGDELPQFINVLKGEMSIVGPRPEVLSEVETYGKEWDEIFSVRPGITDLASIEFSNEGKIISESGIADPHEAYRKLIQPRKLELQKNYVKNKSFFLDLKIIIKTIISIIRK
jgi:lipopolysaccharide/colanic/teichoic acid biosynthesis glycosyltransferase